jgi:hypothetical protein
LVNTPFPFLIGICLLIQCLSWSSKSSRTSGFFSGCQNQEVGWKFLFKDLNIGTLSYFGADSGTKKENCYTPWLRIMNTSTILVAAHIKQ